MSDINLQEIQDFLSRGSNIDQNYNLYVDPRTTIKSAYSSEDNGWVSPENPTTVNLANRRPTTLAHEGAHVQQNLAGLYDIMQRQNKYSAAGNTQQGLKGLNDVISQLRSKYPQYTGANVGDSSREILANLQGIEANLPAGQNVLDTLELPPAYRRLLEHRMFPNSDKLFSSEYTKPKPPLQNQESIAQFLLRKYFK